MIGDETTGYQDAHRHRLTVARSGTKQTPWASGTAKPVANDFGHRSNCPRGQLDGWEMTVIPVLVRVLEAHAREYLVGLVWPTAIDRKGKRGFRHGVGDHRPNASGAGVLTKPHRGTTRGQQDDCEKEH